MDGEPEGRISENGGAAQDAGAESLIDLLTGAAIPATPKNRLVQKVLRQLIETYGFDRSTIRTGYRPTARGRRSASVDIVIFRHGQEPTDDSVERVIVCQTQKPYVSACLSSEYGRRKRASSAPSWKRSSTS